MQMSTRLRQTPKEQEIQQLHEKLDTANALILTVQKRLNKVQKLNGNYFQTAYQLFPKHLGLHHIAAQHAKILHRS
jgi:hypothetical protein